MPVGFDSIRAGASGSADAYEIDYACRFNDNDSANLERTPSGAPDSSVCFMVCLLVDEAREFIRDNQNGYLGCWHKQFGSELYGLLGGR